VISPISLGLSNCHAIMTERWPTSSFFISKKTLSRRIVKVHHCS